MSDIEACSTQNSVVGSSFLDVSSHDELTDFSLFINAVILQEVCSVPDNGRINGNRFQYL
jgi:hypothetical protein